MKRCPSCNRAYDDETLSFCLEDGAPLIRETATRADSQETLVSPSPPVPPPETSGSETTQTYGQLPGKATVAVSKINVPVAPAYTPEPKQRRTWPWVVGILVIAFIVIGGIVIAAIVVPPMLRASRNDNGAQPTPVRPQPTATPTPKVWSAEEADDVPDDEDAVLSQLTKLENEWMEANVKGDKEALARILAEEYSGQPEANNKQEYLDSLKPDPSIKSWELKDLTVDQNGDRATVHGTSSEEKTTGTEVYTFVDKFVWRDHRWQAVASHTSSVK